MNSRELLDMIAEGESSNLEFKRKLNTPEKFSREISALANTNGGYILIGVDDDGSIVGVQSEKTEVELVQMACSLHVKPIIEPSIEIVHVKGEDVVVVSIDESNQKPHKILVHDNMTNRKSWRAYIRMGEKSVMASREMFRLMTYQNTNSPPLKLGIGDREKRLFSYLEVYEKATVRDFAKLVNISKRRAERILISLVRAGVLQIHNDMHSDYFTLK